VAQDVLFRHRRAIAFQTSTLPLTITSNLTATLAGAQAIVIEGERHINRTSLLLSPPPSIGSVANLQVQLTFEIGSLLKMLEAFLPNPVTRPVRGVIAIGLSMLGAFEAVGRMIIRLLLSGVARQAAAAAARHAACVSTRAFISTGRFLANPTAIKGALLWLGQASLRWLRSPSGKAFLWGTSGATFIHLVTPQQQAESDLELWSAVGSLTEALRETEAYMANMTITWCNVVEQQQIQALAMEADHIVDKMLLVASTSVRHVRSQLNSLVEGRFRIDLLSPGEWEALWTELHDTAAKAGMTLLAGNTADLAHLVPRLERTLDGLLVITMDVPAARKEDVMTLLEYVAVPIAAPNTSEAITFQPAHPFLAVAEPDAADHLDAFRTLSLAEKSGCESRTEFVICEGSRPCRSAQIEASLSADKRCLFFLFMANASAMAVACPVTTTTSEDALIPLNKSTVVAVAASDDHMKIVCRAENFFDKIPLERGAVRIDLLPGWELQTHAGSFHAEDHAPETRVIQVQAVDWT
jgi:hypothetical protein